MTAAEQGRRRHAPRSGVVARRWNIGRGRDAPRSEVLALASHYMTAVNQGRRRQARAAGYVALHLRLRADH
jgi:hypothetical protein